MKCREQIADCQNHVTGNVMAMEVEDDSPSTSTSDDLLAVEQIGLKASSHSAKDGTHQKNGPSKVFALLNTLLNRLANDQEVLHTTSSISPLASKNQANANGDKVVGGKIFDWLFDEISRLDILQIQADKASVAINCCYWNIGISYREFCKVRSVS